MATITQTPLIKQWEEMKKKHPDAVLLFRIGDFYECFGEDAVVCSDILKITLTRRANGKADYIHLAGFPHHALDTYLPNLVRAGKRVCICEQLEDPKLKKSPVLELISPAMQPQSDISIKNLSDLISLLSAFNEILNKLYIFDEIRRKTKELRSLASMLGISPKSLFEECNTVYQPSLFD